MGHELNAGSMTPHLEKELKLSEKLGVADA
jgi:hypothetical protein